MKRSCVIALAWLAVVAGQAEAQYTRVLGTISRTDRTAVALLVNAHCDVLWLSQALADSGIPASKVDDLRIGERLVLRAPKCDEPPPEVIAKRTQAILNRERGARTVVKVPEPNGEVAKLQRQVKVLSDEKASLERANANLSRINRELNERQKEPVKQPNSSENWLKSQMTSTLLLRLLGVVLLLVILMGLLRKRMKSPPKPPTSRTHTAP